MCVIAVSIVISYTFKILVNDYGVVKDEAFRLSAHLYSLCQDSGGGFIYSFLYLHGVKGVIKLFAKENLASLYVGKTGFDYLKIINEMIE